jgi:hypothetical protein
MPRTSLRLRYLILRQMPGAAPGLGAKEIHERVRSYARVTVRHALRDLVHRSAIAFTVSKHGRLYFRLIPAPELTHDVE